MTTKQGNYKEAPGGSCSAFLKYISFWRLMINNHELPLSLSRDGNDLSEGFLHEAIVDFQF